MKKVNFLGIAAAVLAMGLGSCNTDNLEGNVDETGQPSYITVSIRSNDPTTTRALGDDNSTIDESLVKTVDVFIYNGAGVFLKHEHLTSANFTNNGTDNKYVATTKIATTTGVRKVHVGVNLPPNSFTALTTMGSTEDKLKNAAMEITRIYVNNLALNGTPMFSEKAVAHDVVSDDTGNSNKFDVTVQRMVAKVVVAKSATMITAGVDGQLGNMEFALNNVHQKIFALQGESPLYKGPNWDAWLAGDFSDTEAANYKVVNATPPATILGYTSPYYALENTFQKKTAKEATRLTVRARFAPKYYYKVDSNPSGYIATNTDDESQSLGNTFYAITPNIGDPTAFFYDNLAAQAYKADKGGDIITYTDGWCYWTSFKFNPLDADKKYQVLRNDIYEFTINSVLTPGKPDAYVDPGTPLDDATYMLVDINIKKWNNPITTGIDLQ